MIEQHRVVGVSCFKHTTTDPSGILLLLVQAPISIFLSINIYIYEYICIHKQIHSPRVVLVDIQGQGVLHLAIIPLFSVARELPLMIWTLFYF